MKYNFRKRINWISFLIPICLLFPTSFDEIRQYTWLFIIFILCIISVIWSLIFSKYIIENEELKIYNSPFKYYSIPLGNITKVKIIDGLGGLPKFFSFMVISYVVIINARGFSVKMYPNNISKFIECLKQYNDKIEIESYLQLSKN